MYLIRRPRVRVAVLMVSALACSAALAAIVRSAGTQQQQPPAAAVGGPARGREVYESHCVECHGPSGKGDGPAASMLMPRPRDFTGGDYKIRSTETGSLPTDEDIVSSVRRGLPGSAMPAWEPILSDADIRAVSGYLKTFSPRFAAETPERVILPAATPDTGESLARGAVAYTKLQCGKCHGADGRGAGAVATSFQDDSGFPIRATDLAEPWTFHGGATAADIFMRFRVGMAGTPMPSFKDAVSDAEMWDLANYVASLRRKATWEMTSEEVTAHYQRLDAEARANPAKRGEYLVDTLACALCHSPVDDERRMLPGMRLAGGMRIRVEPWGTYPTGNLTSDKETGLGNWTDDEIKRAITKGTLRDGMRLLPFPMDWPSFSTMSDADLDAIVAYLRSLPPVRNSVPKPTRTFFPAYLWGKFRMLILGSDPPMTFYAGNAGNTGTTEAH
jgi:mono/diheme cytochrome c family protein